MKLWLITPFFKKNIEIKWLELNTPHGNLVVLQGHAPTIRILSTDKKITYGLPNGKQQSYITHRGIAKINRESITLILDNMEELNP